MIPLLCSLLLNERAVFNQKWAFCQHYSIMIWTRFSDSYITYFCCMSAQIQLFVFFFFKCVSTNLRQVNSSVVFVWTYIPSTPDSSGTCGLAKFPGLSNFASGRIYDRLGCGMAVFSICVFVQTAAMFLFLQKCDLASGFGSYWFQGQGSFQFQQDLCVTFLILFR